MKFPRMLAVFLIMVMVSSQALAAACSVSCSAAEMQLQVSINEARMAAMDADHCDHQQTPEEQQTEHNHCSMAGCHIFTAASMDKDTSLGLPAFGNTELPSITSSEISALLPPPIKPPA